MYSLVLILSVNGVMLEQKQPFFSTIETCEVAQTQAKQDPDVISAVCIPTK
jgi:hypothetical protein